MLICVGLIAPVWADEPPVLTYHSAGESAQVSISGTSTLHDWTVKTNLANGDVAFTGQWQGASTTAVELKSIELSIPTNSLKSTEGSGMDKKVYETLDQTKYPDITYRLQSAKLGFHKDQEYHFQTTGQLTVAGTTRPLPLELTVRHLENNDVIIDTQTSFKMTDFGIKPPTAMFGMIRSGDAITIKASWQLIPRNTGGGGS